MSATVVTCPGVVHDSWESGASMSMARSLLVWWMTRSISHEPEMHLQDPLPELDAAAVFLVGRLDSCGVAGAARLSEQIGSPGHLPCRH